VLEELRSKGYQGGNTAFYAHVRTIKPESQKNFMPYETLPGEQSQFDWRPYSVVIAGVITKVIVFSYINGFSRYRILAAVALGGSGRSARGIGTWSDRLRRCAAEGADR